MMFSPQPFQPFLSFGDFAELFIEESHSLSIRWEGGRVDGIGSNFESGAGLRYLNGLETRFGHTDLSGPLSGALSKDEMARLARVQKPLGEGLPRLTPVSLAALQIGVHPVRVPLKEMPVEEKIALIKRAYNAANRGPCIKQIAVNYGERTKRVGLLNSLGENFYEERVYVVLSVTVTVEREGDLQTGYEALGGLLGAELFQGDGLEKMAIEIANRAHKKLDAPQAPAGPMPVVIASSAGGTLIHEAVGHSLEADAVLEGSSPSYIGKIGQVVGNEQLNVYDDPTVPSARGSFRFDDEGTPAERTLLIENGVLRNYLYDRLSARRNGAKPNGHGRRESYAHKPIPRMSNTYVAPGKDDPRKILSDLKDGLLVTRMGGGQVNTANGDFVFDVEEGFHIQNGKSTLVRGATLLGNGPEVLKSLESIGSDHGWAIGTCGKEGQGVPVSDALPTVRIKSLVIGGQNQSPS